MKGMKKRNMTHSKNCELSPSPNLIFKRIRLTIFFYLSKKKNIKTKAINKLILLTSVVCVAKACSLFSCGIFIQKTSKTHQWATL